MKYSYINSLSAALVATVPLSSGICAHAQDTAPTTAYANFSGSYDSRNGYSIGGGDVIGFQFTSNKTGDVKSFTLPIGRTGYTGVPSVDASIPPSTFNLSLYADHAGQIGKLLGTYVGTTGQYYAGSSTALQQVPANNVTLRAGTRYWLVAGQHTGGIFWNSPLSAEKGTQNAFYTIYGFPVYTSLPSAAFSVQVQTQP